MTVTSPALEKVATRVIFRRYPKRRNGDGGDVIAILLDVEESRGLVTVYQHIGQHGAGYYFMIMGTTKPATVEEYQSLYNELSRMGYVLTVRKRRAIAGARWKG